MFFHSCLRQSITSSKSENSQRKVLKQHDFGWKQRHVKVHTTQMVVAKKDARKTREPLISSDPKDIVFRIRNWNCTQKKRKKLISKNNLDVVKVKRWICTRRPVGVRQPCGALHCLRAQLAQLKAPSASSRLFTSCFSREGKTNLSLWKNYVCSRQIKIILRKQCIQTKCPLVL